MMIWTNNGLTARHRSIIGIRQRLWVPSSTAVKAARWWATVANEMAPTMTSIATLPPLCWENRSAWHSDDFFLFRRKSQLQKRQMSGTTFSKDDTAITDHGENLGKASKTLYLHVGPSGDCWTGDSIFAAKHLQPDYVKSVPLPVKNLTNDDYDDDDMQQKIDNLLEALEDDQELTASIYDKESIPSDVLERIF